MNSGQIKGDKKLMVIDTDAGVDDALAISLALEFMDEWNILAVTCCNGNVEVDKVCQNVMRVLTNYDRKEIPVYRGCEGPLLLKHISTYYHGEDGFGEVGNQFPTGGMELSEGHAVNILTRLAKEHPGQITLVALGPLTNIAMAHRMDPQFTKNLEQLVFMGGNFKGVGNTTDAAEFNFYFDPESAHIILTESCSPVLMIPWETTMNHGIQWEDYKKWTETRTKKADFVKTLTAKLAKDLLFQKDRNFTDCDFLAMAAAVCPKSIEETMRHSVSVETSGTYTRGQAVIEWVQGRKKKNLEKTKIDIVTKFNDGVLNELRNKITGS